MSRITKLMESSIEICDYCGKDEVDDRYNKLHSFKDVICYGWRRNDSIEGFKKEYHLHNGCIIKLLERHLTLPTKSAKQEETK